MLTPNDDPFFYYNDYYTSIKNNDLWCVAATDVCVQAYVYKCIESYGRNTSDDGPAKDTGPSKDTGLAIDPGPVIDLGLAKDFSPVIDSGPVIDLSPVIDSGLAIDSGLDIDFGPVKDLC